MKEKRNIKIVFTGRYNDERNKIYVDELKAFIAKHQLEKNILLTGFISRSEQVNLMKHAKAIIQPSFFEGWSTVVEDAKALNKFLVVSDIQVNREQIKNDVLFFDPKDHLKLADYLRKLNDKKSITTLLDYNENIEDSKNVLLTLFKI